MYHRINRLVIRQRLIEEKIFNLSGSYKGIENKKKADVEK